MVVRRTMVIRMMSSSTGGETGAAILAVPPSEQMKDPRVVGWVLDRLERARDVGDQKHLQELEDLFDEENLTRILDWDDSALISRLFRVVDPRRFTPVESQLLAQWPSWKDTKACWSAVTLARMAPDSFHDVLAGHLPSLEIEEDFNRLGGVLMAIAEIGPPAADLLQIVLDILGDQEARSLFLNPLVKASLRTHNGETVSLLAEAWSGEGTGGGLDSALSAAYETMTSGLPYLEFLRQVVNDLANQRLSDLPELFERGALLEEIDRLVLASPAERLQEAQRLLPTGGDRARVVSFAKELASKVSSEVLDPSGCDRLGIFLLASLAACHARTTYQFDRLDHQSLMRLASADLPALPCSAELIEVVGRFPREEQVALMVGALNRAGDHQGCDNVARMMGKMALSEFVKPLIGLMDRQCNDSLAENAARALARIGVPAEEALISRWSELDDSQRIFGFDVLEYVGKESTVQHLLDYLPEMKGELGMLERWCETARAVPDPRLIDALQPELKRDLRFVRDSHEVLCVLLNRLTPDQVARKRDLLNGVDRVRRTLEALQAGDIEAPRQEAVTLELRCSKCKENNQYQVESIYMGTGAGDSGEPYIGDDLTCLSCGGPGPFETTAMTTMATTVEIMKLLGTAHQEEPQQGPLKITTIQLLDGRKVAPATAVMHYRQRLEKEPNNVTDLLGLGNLYYRLGPKRLAIECYERCLHLEPECVEAAFALAQMHEEAGDLEAAFQRMAMVLETRDRWRYHRIERAIPRELERDFFDFYNYLAECTGRQSVSSPISPEPVRRKKKIGRNERCPCGSGKKYKKCCLRKSRQ